MKTFGKLCVAAVMILAPPKLWAQNTAAAVPPLVINEIATFEESGFEWIEVANTTDFPLDIAGYIFYEEQTKHRLKNVQGDFLLDPREMAIIAQDTEKFLAKYPLFSGTLFDSSWGSLSEDGEEIGLMDTAENALEKFIYVAAKKTSLERADATLLDFTEKNWRSHPTAATPGEKNFASGIFAEIPAPSLTPPSEISVEPPIETVLKESAPSPLIINTADFLIPSPPKVLLHEISFRDEESDWAELYVKEAPAGAFLGGFTLWSDSLLATIPENIFLHPGDLYVVRFQNDKGLTATTEQLILKTPSGEIMDAVCWSDGTVAESEYKDMKILAEKEMWISKDPASCVQTQTLEKNQTVARKQAFVDSDSRDDWTILRHATRSKANIQENQNPTAIITIQSGEMEGEAPLFLNLAGENSFDPEKDNMRFFWDFGDGTFEDTPNPKTHVYREPGNYRLRMMVEDEFEGNSEAFLSISVKPKIVVRQEKVSPTAELYKKDKIFLASIDTPVQQKKEVVKKQTVKKSPQKKPKKRIAKAQNPLSGPLTIEKISSKSTPSKSPPKHSASPPLKMNSGAIVRITEVFPNPEDNESENEWIELFNPTDRPISLFGWSLDDNEKGSKPYWFPRASILAPNEYKIVSRKESKLALNNEGDAVRLLRPNGSLAENVAYEKASAGKSFSLIGEKWEWTDDATPGKENPVYFAIEGKIEMVNPTEKFIVVKHDEKSEKIFFDESLLSPLIAPLALPKNGTVRLQAAQNKDGNFALRRIDEVYPEDPPPSADYGSWIIGGALSFVALANMAFFVFYKDRSSRS